MKFIYLTAMASLLFSNLLNAKPITFKFSKYVKNYEIQKNLGGDNNELMIIFTNANGVTFYNNELDAQKTIELNDDFEIDRMSIRNTESGEVFCVLYKGDENITDPSNKGDTDKYSIQIYYNTDEKNITKKCKVWLFKM